MDAPSFDIGPTGSATADTDHEVPATPRTARIVGSLFLSAGLLLLALGASLLLDTRAFVARAETAQGVVVALSRNIDGGTAPVFRFVTPDGRAVEAPTNVFSTPPAWTVGERATLRYDPSFPERARPDTLLANHLGPVIVLPLGATLAMAGAIILARTRRRTT